MTQTINAPRPQSTKILVPQGTYPASFIKEKIQRSDEYKLQKGIKVDDINSDEIPF